MATLAPPVLLRSPRHEDIPFILSSWIRSYQESNFARGMRKETFAARHKDVVMRLLSESLVTVACDPNDPNDICGYAVYRPASDGHPPVLHYVYVKFAFRRMGLARHMVSTALPTLGKDPLRCTHANKWLGEVRDRYLLDYDPYGAF